MLFHLTLLCLLSIPIVVMVSFQTQKKMPLRLSLDRILCILPYMSHGVTTCSPYYITGAGDCITEPVWCRPADLDSNP